MTVDISWWDLDGTHQTLESLRNDLRETSAGWWRNVPGLRQKLWIADRRANRWGAVMIWKHDAPDPSTLPPNRCQLLLGVPATSRQRFSVEASLVGGAGLAGEAGSVGAGGRGDA